MEQTDWHDSSGISGADQHAESTSPAVSPDLELPVPSKAERSPGTGRERGQAVSPKSLSSKSSDSGEVTCVICFQEPSEVRLEPCGHNKFCRTCAAKIHGRCPLCRQRVASTKSQWTDWRTLDVLPQQPNLAFTTRESVRGSLAGQSDRTLAIEPQLGPSPQQQRPEESTRSERYWHQLSLAADYLLETYDEPPLLVLYGATCLLAVGLACFTGAWNECVAAKTSLGQELEQQRRWWLRGFEHGGLSRFIGALLAIAAVVGTGIRVRLLYGMWRQGKPMRVCGTLVFIVSAIATLGRVLIVDAPYRDPPQAYSIYRTPHECDAHSNMTTSWTGSDDIRYCVHNSTPWNEATFYLATSAPKFTRSCSTFSADSAVLDFWDCDSWFGKVVCPSYSSPYSEEKWNWELCDRLEWVIGARLGALHGISSYLNAYADVGAMMLLAMQPAGRMAPAFLMAVFLFQLGLMLPVTHFSHGGCLRVSNPLGISLSRLQDGVFALGSLVQSWTYAANNFLLAEVFVIGALGVASIPVFIASCAGIVNSNFPTTCGLKWKWWLVGLVAFLPCALALYGIFVLLVGSFWGCETLVTIMLQWIVGAEDRTVHFGLALAFDMLAKFMTVGVAHMWPSLQHRFLGGGESSSASLGEGSATTIGRTAEV
mmetsp:Transcript_55125/g.102071  ORF Transcript_55125/g.102071 Transcript_55125/m.102071 type:complete len:653 (+) Transcript_55125:21-1979(+)